MGLPEDTASEGPVVHHLLRSQDAWRRGASGEAALELTSAMREVERMPQGSRWRLEAEARVDLVNARRSLGAGDLQATRRLTRRVLGRMGSLTEPPQTLMLAASELLAMTSIMRCEYEAALKLLSDVVADAESAGDPWVARIQRLMGAIHARRGRPLLAAKAYRIATERLAEESAPLEIAKLCSNLAMTSFMAGQLTTARAAIERALRLRRAHDAPASELANSTAVLALICEAEGLAEATACWDAALELARQGPDTLLTAEIELRAANAAILREDAASASHLARTAVARVSAMGRAEPTITSMAHEVRARLALLERDLDGALASGREALLGYRTIEAVYHEARLELFLAVVARRGGDNPATSGHVERACTLALRGGFELPLREEDREVLVAAATAGERMSRRYGLARDIPLGSDVILLVEPEGTIEVGARSYDLGPRAILYRIARILVRAAPGGATMRELCQRLWRGEPFDDRTRNRLKVHIHRLRELLGGEVPCIITVTPTGQYATQATYRWNPAVHVRVVTRARAKLTCRR